MSDIQYPPYHLNHDTARRNASAACLTAPAGYVVRISEPKRSEDASSKFHAICTDLEKSKLEWFGKPRTKEEWKILLISGHAKATGSPVELVQGLEGELVNIRESSSKMGVKRMSSLVEYSLAFGAERGVKFNLL